MSDTAEHPIAPVEPKQPRDGPRGAIKSEKGECQPGGRARERRAGGGVGGGRGGEVSGTGATGNTVMLQSTEGVLKGW